MLGMFKVKNLLHNNKCGFRSFFAGEADDTKWTLSERYYRIWQSLCHQTAAELQVKS